MTELAEIEVLVHALCESGGCEPLDQRAHRRARALLPTRPHDARRRREHAVRRIARFARGFRRSEGGIPMEVYLRADRDVNERPIVLATGFMQEARLRLASSGYWAAWSIETLCRLVTWVSGSIWEAPDASFIACRGNTAPTCLLTGAISAPYGTIASTTGKIRFRPTA